MAFENESDEKESWKISKDDKEENLDAASITQVDLTKVWFFMEQHFEKMLHVTGTRVDSFLVGLILQHVKRVADLAEYIGKKSSLDVHLIRFEALCHDFQKIDPAKIGGMSDVVPHAILQTGPLVKFMIQDLKKNARFVKRICEDIFEHINTPAVVEIGLRKSGSFYGYVLRCANMLDYVSASGLMHDVELRQRKHCDAYKEDGGDFNKAWISSLEKRDKFLDDLINKCPLYKTMWKGFDQQLYLAREAIVHLANISKARSENFIKVVESAKPKTLAEFRKLCKVFNEQQLQLV